MIVRVIWDDGHDHGDFEYYSKFNRINAKGIKEEIKNEMFKRFSSRAFYIEIVQFYRVDD